MKTLLKIIVFPFWLLSVIISFAVLIPASFCYLVFLGWKTIAEELTEVMIQQ